MNLLAKLPDNIGRLGMLAAAILFLALVVVFPGDVVLFKKNPGRFDRKTMEAVVAQLRSIGLQPGDQKEFMLRDLSDPKSLTPLAPDNVLLIGTGAGHVWARLSTDRMLTVVIETRDLGHAGEYGFAYSDVPLTPRPSDWGKGWYTLDVPGNLLLVVPNMKIDDHWWKVLNNLD